MELAHFYQTFTNHFLNKFSLGDIVPVFRLVCIKTHLLSERQKHPFPVIDIVPILPWPLFRWCSVRVFLAKEHEYLGSSSPGRFPLTQVEANL